MNAIALDVSGTLSTVCYVLMLLPQIGKVVRDRSAHGINWAMLIVGCMASSTGLVYALLLPAPFVVLSSGLYCIQTMLLMVLKLYFSYSNKLDTEQWATRHDESNRSHLPFDFVRVTLALE